jgi:para-nitrobenzyl esterase
MRVKSLILLFVVALVVAITVTPLSGCGKPVQESQEMVVALDSGKIRGTLVDGVWTYLGIPFAAPPVGELRWREPQPVKSWEGIRDCNNYGLACPQPKSLFYDVGQTGEDCLYLNVWTPATSPDGNLPVMVWIHGGSFNTGAGSIDMYNGKNLARQNVVLVTINYRLGPLGFLSHPSLSKESTQGVSGNYGLLDQIAALKWVQKNVQAFGGNPDLVTIFGESAGAMCVCDLMISPLADGLFQRAIAQSGSFGDAYPLNREDTVEKAENTGREIAVKLGCDTASDVLAAMRQRTADEVVKAAFTGYDPNGGTKMRPVIDGWVIPENPWSLFSAGKQQKVPLLIGTNADEGSIFVYPDPKVLLMSGQDYQEYVKSLYKDHAAEVLALFPATSKWDVPAAVSKLRTIMSFSAGALHAADTTSLNAPPVYMYRFTRIPDTALKIFGAFHGLEIFYVFGNLRAGRVSIPDNTADVLLSEEMMKYWANFATSGDPNGPGLQKWPAYTKETGQYIGFGNEITAGSGLYNEYHNLIDNVTRK